MWESISNFFRTKPVLISEKAEKLLGDPQKTKELMDAIDKLKKREAKGYNVAAGKVESGKIVVEIVGKAQRKK